MTTKVMVFGTFDILHKGHEFYISKAKQYGDYMIAVIGRDSTVAKLKGSMPKNDEIERVKQLQKSQLVNEVILGNQGDKYKVIEEHLPDVLIFGYDQQSFNIGIEKELKKRNLESIKIIQIEESFKPEIYKSSKLK